MNRHLALHPDPNKQGVTINADKYFTVRSAIVSIVRTQQPIPFEALIDAVRDVIGASFQGSIPWYVTTVKLDLEARGMLERVPDLKPQHLRLTPRAAASENPSSF